MIALTGVPFTHKVVEKSPVTLQSLSAGMRFVWQQKEVMAAMTLDMFAVLLGGATSLMPVFAKDILRVGPSGLGWLLSAPSIGAFTTAMIQAHRRPYEKAGPVMLAAVLGFGAATIVFGLSQHFWLSLLMLVLLGVCDNVSVVIRQTLIQVMTPDHMRGRVSALNSVFIGTSNELGGFESGLVAGFFGPVFSVVSGGIGTLFVVFSVARLLPEIRRYGRLDL
jgi:MFS family permease